MSTPIQFVRSNAVAGKSFTLRRYLRDQEELNHYYWASRFSYDIAGRQVKKYAELNAVGLLQQLNTSSESSESMGHAHADIVKRMKTSDRWLRLSVLLAACSAFERYMKSIVETAVESDPLLTPGWNKRLDGLLLKKHGIAPPLRPIEAVVKGDWSQRGSEYGKLFGSQPAQMIENRSELEKMRKLRNAVAHEFGTESSGSAVTVAPSLSSTRRVHRASALMSVTHERLLRWLAIFNTVARSVDEHLVREYIGDYEIAATCLEWRADPDRVELELGVALDFRAKQRLNRFSSVIGSFYRPLGSAYELTLRRFLDKL